MRHSRVGLNEIKDESSRLGIVQTYTHVFIGGIFILSNVFTFEFTSSAEACLLLLGFNIICCISYAVVHFERMTRIRQHPYQTMQDTIDQVHQMIQQIIHAYFEQHQMEYQLSQAHTSLERFHTEYNQLMHATRSEATKQYQTILAYAHYLEQRITTHRSDASLRDDYDDVCEQAFNLQLIVQAMGMLAPQAAAPTLGDVSLTDRMASIVLDLAPSLDRRAMKLTTTAWDEHVHAISNNEWITHVLWMMLLGSIRFAETESTLALSCAKEGSHVKVDVVISFLSPGALSETERYAYLQKRMLCSDDEAHMFASTLEMHANIQLGKMLAERLGARLSVAPLHAHACTLSLLLPCAQ